MLAIMQVNSVMRGDSVNRRRRQLASLSANLSAAYTESLSRILGKDGERKKEQDAKLAGRIFMWVCLCQRNLTFDELLHALSNYDDDPEFDWDNHPPKETLLDKCHGLVVLDKETSTVRLVHQSLAEHFKKDPPEFLKKGHSNVAATCLRYLLFPSLRSPWDMHELGKYQDEDLRRKVEHTSWSSSRNRQSVMYLQNTIDPDLADTSGVSGVDFDDICMSAFDEMSKEFPFLAYSASYWPDHIRQSAADTTGDVLALCLTYLSQPTLQKQRSYFQLEYRRFRGHKKSIHCIGPSSLHIAAHFGLGTAIHMSKFVLGSVDEIDKSGRTALWWAARYGHLKSVEMLLDLRASVHIEDVDFLNPLHAAAEAGMKAHLDVIKALVDHGAKVEGTSESAATPLQLAALQNRDEAVDCLWALKADICPPGQRHGLYYGPAESTPFLLAVQMGNAKVINVLIKRNAQGTPIEEFGEVMHWLFNHYINLSRRIHLEALLSSIECLLANHKVNPDYRSSAKPTLLYSAAWFCADLVPLLLRYGANPNYSTPSELDTPLHNIGRRAYGNTVEYLIKWGAIVNKQNKYGETALHKMVINGNCGEPGNFENLQCLLKHIDKSIKDRYGRTAVELANFLGDPAGIKPLVRAGIASLSEFDIKDETEEARKIGYKKHSWQGNNTWYYIPYISKRGCRRLGTSYYGILREGDEWTSSNSEEEEEEEYSLENYQRDQEIARIEYEARADIVDEEDVRPRRARSRRFYGSSPVFGSPNESKSTSVVGSDSESGNESETKGGCSIDRSRSESLEDLQQLVATMGQP